MTKKIRTLKKVSNIVLISFPFENTNRRTLDSKKPSELTWDCTFITMDSDILISDTERSDKFEAIKDIVGTQHYNDIRHIDTAYKENCKIFLTPDKDDIANNAEKLEEITGIKFFHCDDFSAIENYIKQLNEYD